MKEDIFKAREDSLEFEEWKGRSDATYYISFAKTLSESGLFDTEKIFEMVMKRQEYDRDISLMEISAEMNNTGLNRNQISGNKDECQCSDCKSERGEGDDPSL